MSGSLMDTEPGGENTQYESINTVNKSRDKDSGQLISSNEYTEADMQAAQQQKERGEQTAENVRYGEALSEHGFGGETTTNSGQSGQDGFGSTTASTDTSDNTNTRAKQGFGGGSGVGA